MIPATPRGFRDVLPEEAAIRERIVSQVQARFAGAGYLPIETPTLESVAALDADRALSTTPFRFFDVDGNQLALRPDVTLPVARLAATRMRGVPRPLRLRYTAPVFREEESLRGQAREFTQLGVELIGQSSAEDDAEVVSLFVEALYAAGLRSFVVDVATVEVLRALVDGACDDEAWAQQVFGAYHDSNWVFLDKLAAKKQVRPAFGAALSALPRIAGGPEAVEACREIVAPLGCDAGLDRLAATLGLLEERGVLPYVRVDFSVMNSLDYYTGIVMQAYATGTPRPIGSGGRYDNLLAAFGSDEPAAGFAFGLETLIAASGSGSDAVDPDASADVADAPDLSAAGLPPLRIAVPKGSLNPGSLEVLDAAGMDVACLRDPGRQMTFESTWGDVPVQLIIVRPSDAPVFVANGGADVGIAGEDSIVEADLDVNELADLAFGGCKFVVAEAAEREGAADAAYRRRGVLRVATKYPNVTRAYYDRIGVQVDIIKLHGNIELAPRTGMADRIVDITATGTSLRENNLRVVDDVLPSTARFIASPSAAHVDPRVRDLSQSLVTAVARLAAEKGE